VNSESPDAFDWENYGYWSASGIVRSPLWDTAGGAGRNRDRDARCQSHVTTARLRLDHNANAATRLVFPPGDPSAARPEGARSIAAAYGVETRRVEPPDRRKTLTLAVYGDAEDVVRFAAGAPRVLDYAETLTTEAARSYGRWTRHSQARQHLARLNEHERQARTRRFREETFRVVVDVLVSAPDAVLPAVDTSLTPWEQVRAIAGGIAQYGWVEVGAAYDPAQARAMLAEAGQVENVGGTAGHWPADSTGEQLPLPLPWPIADQPLKDLLVVIPCSGAKLDHPAPVGEMYIGPLHKLARQAADALIASGGTVVVLSALHGILPLTQKIEPYDHQWKDPGSVTREQLRDQAVKLGVADATEVILLTPGEYSRRAADVWPHARTPLAHLGIGYQLSRLTAIRDASTPTAAA
jgi:hypothetical protein